MTGTLSAFTSLGVYGYPIPERSEATPGLFNQIFSGLSANLDRLNSDVSNIVGSSVGTTESILGFSSNTLRAESGNTIIALPYTTTLISRSIDSGGAFINVRAFGAVGNGVVDDTSAISSAYKASQAIGIPLYFPPGNFLLSEDIIGQPGTTWLGAGLPNNASISTEGTVINATGTGKGIFKYRPGNIGDINPVSGQREITFKDIAFSGNSVTGHLINIARIVHANFYNCGFSNSAGTGLKDDQTTGIGAAGVYAFGTEIVRFFGCNFENNTNGAGYAGEASVHDVGFWGCHFNNSLHNARSVGADNGQWAFYSTHFNAGEEVLWADSGGLYNVVFMDCWAEQQTGTNSIISASGAAANAGIYLFSNNFLGNGPNQPKTAIYMGGVDNLLSHNNRFSTFSFVYNVAPSSGGGGSVDEGNNFISCTTVFFTNSPSVNGFVRSGTSAAESFFVPLFGVGGTALAPTYAYSSESSLGWYRSAASTLAQSYGTIFLAPNSTDRLGIGTKTPAFKVTNNMLSPQTFTNAGGDFSEMWQANGTNALGISLQTGVTTAFLVVNNAYDLSLTVGTTERARLKNADGRWYLGAGEALPDGTALAPASAFSSELSLGLYRSAVNTLALSLGTIDLTAAVTSIGSLKIKAGVNQSCGTAILGSNGSVNVANTYVKTGDLIFLTDQSPGGTLGDIELGGIRNSSGFTIQSTSVTDTSTVAWLIVRPG